MKAIIIYTIAVLLTINLYTWALRAIDTDHFEVAGFLLTLAALLTVVIGMDIRSFLLWLQVRDE